VTRQSAARQARRTARRLSTPIVRLFIADRCERAETPTPGPVLYAAYLLWCAQQKHLPISPEDFHAVAGARTIRQPYQAPAIEQAQRHGYKAHANPR
jgi:hypothetical protein